MTCHVLHAGDGYTYLTNQVAAGDVQRSAHEGLGGYYTAQGNPPGQWVGSGIAALGMAGQVSEEHMLALFGEGLHPEANAMIERRIAAGHSYDAALRSVRLGRKYYTFTTSQTPLSCAVTEAYAAFARDHARRPSVAERRRIKEQVATRLLTGPDGVVPAPEVVRKYLIDELGRTAQPVAGADLVFSPRKSVSVVWALGDEQTRAVVEQVHRQAWQAALAYGEREAAFTRVGRNGVAQVETSGFVATAFDHRDSRSGDPDLHTHVVIANRVRAADGTWRTFDSQQLHRVAVSMSEYYNAALEQGLTERLGVRWIEVDKGNDKRVVREIEGVSPVLITGFSQRRTQVEGELDELVAQYVRDYGHTPPRSVQITLAQQATLTARPDKVLRSLHEQIADWTARAQDMLPGADITAEISQALHRAPVPAAAVDLDQVAATVIGVVQAHRSSWTVYHVRAEAIRQLTGHPFATGAERERATEQVVATALNTGSVVLGAAPGPTPVLLQRSTGESIFTRRGATRYTSQALLDAESRLLAAARAQTPLAVAAPVARAAITTFEQRTGRTLNPGQRVLVEQVTGGGRELAVAVGPPGTGKSVAMGAVRQVWEQSTGGRVIGLAPSAAAARVLGEELGVRADTAHRLIALHSHGRDIDVKPGDMLLVDEAGMAGTLVLDQVRAIAAEHGAVVRLVGDHKQLTAVEAGGALRLLVHEVGGPELTQVMRFRDPAEATAVLQVRDGRTEAIDWYAAHERLHAGPGPAVRDQLYRDWAADTAAGTASIMISDSVEVATALSQRAQAERRAVGLVESRGIGLHDGTVAAVGDRIVTRHNDRRLELFGGNDFVRNGDLWDVLARDPEGGLRVRHIGHGAVLTLPPGYVAAHVELGYAATIHRAQGITVQVSRAYLSPLAVRQGALVALSRGTEANHAYLDAETTLAPGEPETLPGDLFYRYRESNPAALALATIVRRDGAEPSATEQLRQALEETERLDHVVPRYTYALTVHRGPEAGARAEAWVGAALPSRATEILADPAWPTLAEVLHRLDEQGQDPVRLLAARAAQRPLESDPADPARSTAQVLHHRLLPDLTPPAAAAGRPPGLPGWVPTPPPEPAGTSAPVSVETAELGQWLREQAETIAARVRWLGEQAVHDTPPWTVHLGPVPDDPVDRAAWIDQAGQVAAWREHFGASPDHLDLLPGGEHGEAAHARAWVQQHLATTPVVGQPGEQADHLVLDFSEQAMVERMTRWRTEFDRTYQPDLDAEAAAELDRDRVEPEQDAVLATTEAGHRQEREQAGALPWEDLHAQWAALHERLREARQVEGVVQRAQIHAEVRAAREAIATEYGSEVTEALREWWRAGRQLRELQRAQRRGEIQRSWEQRPHAGLTDTQLTAAITAAEQDSHRHQRDADRAEQDLRQRRPAVEAGHGSRVMAVDEGLARAQQELLLRQQAEQAQRHRATATQQARIAAARADALDREAAQVSWLRPGHRDALDREAEQLRETSAWATAQADVHRHQQTQAQQQLEALGSGGYGTVDAATQRLEVAERRYAVDRAAAQAGDEDELRRLGDQVERGRTGARGKQDRVGELRSEQEVRSGMTSTDRDLDVEVRAEWQQDRREEAAARRRQWVAQQSRGAHHDYAPHVDHGIHHQPGHGLSL
ncbi:conjugative relaxase-like TrwC/TraI family protein [Kutzneria viridogrisea]|uniref:Conjugative relaxase-like TrwC/TraI family protein n=1 Tax=Kutzneria viridogrisea TaxID=47990 RepID=A0ABR6C050_9PSEU|nr:conjugative relaxase-like TrwC/TraI family protein [Kutzneria viridogrisea]